ncbi:DegT/DnrJ/EryC1/StrS family aminotransferase [Photobacterium frigidiphilum]|uniref:DegT/DnrJ/EryC1/StrS family aminotransferase n=1 Tax=Photobacterium frigidiphilum TaxID=264736 RepID=UPI003D0F737F
MLNVTKTYMPPIELYESYLKEIWDSSQVTNNGALVKKLEVSLSEKLNIKNIELVSNGTLALQLALKALNIRGDVITTPFSYVATTTSILWENCNPIFVDIEMGNFCINPDLIEQAITEETTAILATHVYGYPCEVEKIQKIADKYNLKVIYDAAHAFGVTYKGKSLLEYGDISTLSFHATKLFHTGEGGAIVSTDNEILKKVSLSKSFGHIGEEKYIDIGINAKMSELHAAMGLCVLDKVDDIISHRKKCSQLYDEFLELDDSIIRPQLKQGVVYNYAYYPIILSCKEHMLRVRDALNRQNIFPRRYFYPSLNKLSYIDKKVQCPVSESISSRVLALPLSHELSEKEIRLVSTIILEAVK